MNIKKILFSSLFVCTMLALIHRAFARPGSPNRLVVSQPHLPGNGSGKNTPLGGGIESPVRTFS
jgi:hypothetical protein